MSVTEARRKGVTELEDQRGFLRMVRLLALGGLPRCKTAKDSHTRIMRLGRSAWVEVTFRAAEGKELPSGSDRWVLAGILHLALQQRACYVRFETACQLLDLFGSSKSGKAYALLRERLKRLVGMVVSVKVASSETGLGSDGVREFHRVLIEEGYLPSRAEMVAQGVLPFKKGEPEQYFVKLNEGLFRELLDEANEMLVPLHVLREFAGRPLAWDFAVFLFHRCGSATAERSIPQSVLVELFADGKGTPARVLISRLKVFLDEVIGMSGGAVQASFEEDKGRTLGKLGRGRPKKNWKLVVRPSRLLAERSGSEG